MTPSSRETYNRYKKYSTDLSRYYRLPAVQTSLSVVLSLFISAFFILVAMRPTFITIATLKKTIEESEKTLKALNTKANALSSISKTWEQISPLAKFIDNSIPVNGPRYQELTRAMEILAIENNVEIVNENIGEALTFSSITNPYSGRNRSVVAIPFTIRVTGDYQSVGQFFGSLVAVERIISLDSVAFSKEAKLKDGTSGVSLAVSGSAHYLADEAQLSKVLSPTKKGVVTGTTPDETEADEGN